MLSSFLAEMFLCSCPHPLTPRRICVRRRIRPHHRSRHRPGEKPVARKLPNFLNRRVAAYKEESTMKKLTALTAACVLIAGLAFAGQPSEADQKWLEVVQKKVTEGQTRISTPIAERVSLLKDWADKNGYTVAVSQSENSYRLELAKNIAQK
jgi:hypothetical protein